MEEVLSRFGHLGKQIFEKLDVLTLLKCKQITRPWNLFIDIEKIAVLRVVRIKTNAPRTCIKKILRRLDSDSAKQFAFDVCHIYGRFPSGTGKINSEDSYYSTPLHYAIRNKHWLICELIIENILDKNPTVNPHDQHISTCKSSNTLLHLAAEAGKLELCKLIVPKIEVKNPRKANGWTPLHFAAKNGHIEICRLIINALTVDKNPKSIFGPTPLHLAANYGHLEVCKLIIENIHEKNPRSSCGRTPLQLALQNNHSSVVDFIRFALETSSLVKNRSALEPI